eukprot:c11709_g1_i1.p1 GENE.c11709_g1_i1~~c11709_g1_i1.p1  ORF type:complete len:128 (-),score=44.37 c11709_g1_i1:26-409(-)
MSGTKVIRLKGHSDNIRSLCLSQDGTKIISGSSDHTIKIWDIGQQSCIGTIRNHLDSVWTLSADTNFRYLVSGSRDKTVCLTSLQTFESNCVCVFDSQVCASTFIFDENSNSQQKIAIGTADANISL